MASSLRRNLEEQVTCAICYEHYRDPRLLPCLHTYCKQCLDDLVEASRNKGQIACPECREVAQLGPSGTNHFKAHFQMNNLMSLLTISTSETQSGSLSCENCTSNDAAKGRCSDCCVLLCDFCLKAHQRFKDTQEHKIMSLEEVKKQGAPAMTQQVKCDKHKGEVKKLYCESCQQLICRDCTIIDHRDHKFQFIDEVAGRHVKNLKSDIENATAVKDRIQQSLEEIKTTKFNINVTAVQMGKDVDKAIDQKIQSLEQQRKALKKEVEAKTNVKIGNLEKQENDILTKMKNLKSAIDFTENALQSTNVNILSLSSEAGSRLKSLTRIQFKGQPCEKDTLFFQDDDQKFQNILKSMMKVLENKNQYDAGHQPGRPGNYGYLRHYYGNE